MRVFAPAKINLYLHVLKRLPNGYHALDSLIAFADIGDEIEISPASHFSFQVEGRMAGSLGKRDLIAGPDSGNLLVKAVWRLAQFAERTPDIAVTLTKNLPAGAGIGGGSSDAAATIWALCQLWNIPRDADFVETLLSTLGADVPVCFEAQAARIQGIGDTYHSVPVLPEMPIVLAYPGKPCATSDVFDRFDGEFRDLVALPSDFGNIGSTAMFLKNQSNDLLPAARKLVPEIDNVILDMEGQPGCLLSRMSGSGSCCFGLFEDEDDAVQAAITMRDNNPDWWVKAGWIGRVGRY